MNDSNPDLPSDVRPILRASSDIEAIRYKYFGHETNIKVIGSICLITGLLLTSLGGIVCFIEVFYDCYIFEYGVLTLIGGVALLLIGYGVLTLKNWVRIPTIILAIGLTANFPIGTIFGIYILYLLLTEKGRFLFSPEYQEILEATYYIRYTTPWYVYQLFIVLLCLFLGAGLIAI